MKAIEIYGKDWKKVQQYVGTRTSAQSRSHAQKVLPKSEFEDTNPVACTPQKKLQPLEASFEKLDCASIASAKIMQPKHVIEYEPPAVQTENGNVEMSDSQENMLELKCSRQLNEVPHFEPNKRKWTDEPDFNGFSDNLMIENDEVSQRLLQKLTTPKQTSRLMSFSYSNANRFGLHLDFDSEIESLDDEFNGRSSFDMPPLNDYIAKNMGNSYF
jgi:hypothetical protein